MIEAAEVSTGITKAVALQRGHYAGGIISETPLWQDCCGAFSATLVCCNPAPRWHHYSAVRCDGVVHFVGSITPVTSFLRSLSRSPQR